MPRHASSPSSLPSSGCSGWTWTTLERSSSDWPKCQISSVISGWGPLFGSRESSHTADASPMAKASRRDESAGWSRSASSMPSIPASASYTPTRWTWRTDTSRTASATTTSSRCGSRSTTDHLSECGTCRPGSSRSAARIHNRFELAALAKHLVDQLDAESERVKTAILASANQSDIASWFTPTSESPEWVNVHPGEAGPISPHEEAAPSAGETRSGTDPGERFAEYERCVDELRPQLDP